MCNVWINFLIVFYVGVNVFEKKTKVTKIT